MIHLFPPPKHFKLTGGELNRSCNQEPVVQISNSLPAEAYRLEINQNSIQIQGDEPGVRYAKEHLAQLVEQFSDSEIPCCLIEDEPSLQVRGFMLDVSRCRVPTMSSVRALIQLLGKLRYNQFQLYIEHTFAFKDHKTVWQDASPFTPEEIQELDNLCQEQGIELVPNFNSFGHFERWLRHEPYKHLAECPEGFRREVPLIIRDHGGTLKPNQDSIDFLKPLHAEFLANFSSKQFNVGLDEPWELGQGWSKEQVQKEGKQAVYLEFLKEIHQSVSSHDRKMLFWSDIILEKPEYVEQLPAGVVPVIWGYESDHPFPEQCAKVAESGLDYLVAPGTSTWNSFNGRISNALENIQLAIDNAVTHGAKGSLLTSWGDNGNHQPWPLLHPALFYHAQVAWNHHEIEKIRIPDVMNRVRYKDPSGKTAKVIFSLGNGDVLMEKQLINSSPSFHFLFGTQDKLANTLGDLEPRFLKRAAKHLWETKGWLEDATPQSSDADWLIEELQMGIDLGILGIQRAQHFQEHGNLPEQTIARKELAERFRQIWQYRARPGGLEESLSFILENNGKII